MGEEVECHHMDARTVQLKHIYADQLGDANIGDDTYPDR